MPTKCFKISSKPSIDNKNDQTSKKNPNIDIEIEQKAFCGVIICFVSNF